MSNQYIIIIFVEKFKEPEAKVKWQFTVMLTRSSAVAKKPSDVPCP